MRVTTRLFGVRHAWPALRRQLCDAAARPPLLCAKATCHIVRDILYLDDPRWRATAEDPGYEAIYPHRKWPVFLRSRCGPVEVELLSGQK